MRKQCATLAQFTVYFALHFDCDTMMYHVSDQGRYIDSFEVIHPTRFRRTTYRTKILTPLSSSLPKSNNKTRGICDQPTHPQDPVIVTIARLFDNISKHGNHGAKFGAGNCECALLPKSASRDPKQHLWVASTTPNSSTNQGQSALDARQSYFRSSRCSPNRTTSPIISILSPSLPRSSIRVLLRQYFHLDKAALST